MIAENRGGLLVRVSRTGLLCWLVLACGGKPAPGSDSDSKIPAKETPMATVDSQVDSVKAARADIVLRARLLQPGVGSKYLWDSVQIVRVVKNQSGASLPDQIVVAHYSWEPGIPPGACTVYLESFTEEGGGGWKLLDGSAKNGVSHVDP